ncbi:hypothetical protein PPL_07107 [Heterostelium album PN500]|uniref:Essential protein Yae1 N-terminal domain-containing protein n=1 Tax=Heterostelium pallidum (strain ATCC 26659 / Pp 5 / PN500) TaxID=670386 RepID=D3BEE8_HETP5|nr:hypothetical protein PPL_07107 [Heterostelium album PN500]EFA80279.1 hypothetical protein PPL_07107 [Heterostelium album PN500]|eukprot:XP_020432399.1 hypothetical protein PPL_07107 [Heterostelium album PN500]
MSSSNNNDFDDFYGDDDHDINMFSNDAIRSQNNIFPIGYQDGLEDGKNQTLQRGFNEGLKESSEIAYKWSLLIGAISSLDVFYHHNKSMVSEEQSKLITSLEDMQSRLKAILNLHCSPPTIDMLKVKFNNYSHTDTTESDLSAHLSKATITSNKVDSCCKSSSSSSCCEDGDDSGCCGGSNNKQSSNCKSQQQQEAEEESCNSDVDGDNSGCCGGRGDDGGCCKKSEEEESTTTTIKTTTLTSTSAPIIHIEEDKELFNKLCGECKEIFNRFGLDGNAIISSCVEKQFRVINTQN